jgi:hypothetical protein
MSTNRERPEEVEPWPVVVEGHLVPSTYPGTMGGTYTLKQWTAIIALGYDPKWPGHRTMLRVRRRRE